MNGLIEQARRWWIGRSVREQRLLLIMGVLAGAVLLWLAVVRPVFAWREGAAERRAEAQVELMLIQAGTARVSGGPSGLPPAEVQAAARTAADGIGLNAVFNPGDGGVGFTVQGARSGALFGWLAALQTQNGIEARSLTVSENADATVNAEGLLSGPPAQSAAR